MRPIKKLEGKKVAIIGLGSSQIDYVIARENSKEWDEVWGINSAASVLEVDRLFMMDPASRFLDSDDAGNQTEVMRKILPKLKMPIYTCELDPRVPALVEYPLMEVANYSRCAYFNNTVAYTIGFAYWNKVAQIDLFGIDFSYQHSMHFAEAGRACVEFWLSKCIEKGIIVGASPRSAVLLKNPSSSSKKPTRHHYHVNSACSPSMRTYPPRPQRNLRLRGYGTYLGMNSQRRRPGYFDPDNAA